MARLPIVSVPLYFKGDTVIYNGREYTVSHVIIAQHNVQLKLDGIDDPVSSDLIRCEDTIVDFNKMRTSRDLMFTTLTSSF